MILATTWDMTSHPKISFRSTTITSLETDLHRKYFTLFLDLPFELRLKIYDQILALSESPRILQISSSPHISHYISNVPPPILLAVSSESRAYALRTYNHLSLGPPILSSPSFAQPRPKRSPLPIPISYRDDILYLSGLSPIFPSHMSNTIYHLSTSSSSRHLIRYLAVDFRVWTAMCDHGLLSCLAQMRGLREVFMVLEFGRSFTGQLGFLQVPEWRSDLMWSAQRAFVELNRARDRAREVVRKESDEGERGKDVVNIRCVILTRGGEQA